MSAFYSYVNKRNDQWKLQYMYYFATLTSFVGSVNVVVMRNVVHMDVHEADLWSPEQMDLL